MKIVVLNDIHIGKALTSNGKVRASSHLIEEQLDRIFENILEQHSPNLVVNLGDLIRSEGKEQDLKSYSEQLARFKKFQAPVIHLVGNHELKKLSLEEIEKVWSNHGFKQRSFGSFELNDFLIIWLGLDLDVSVNPHGATLPKQQIEWLKRELQSVKKKVLIFSHYALDDHDTTGNFFFEAMDNRSKAALFLHNQNEVIKIIRSCSQVKGVFQAHLHYFHVKMDQNVPYITCPALGDNICAPKIIDNIPEIYTTIQLDQSKMVVKAYSGEFCFAGYEQSFN